MQCRIFGVIHTVSMYDATSLSLSVRWTAINVETGQFLGLGDDAIPAPLSMTDSELSNVARQGLADVVTSKGLVPDYTFLASDVMGCQL